MESPKAINRVIMERVEEFTSFHPEISPLDEPQIGRFGMSHNISSHKNDIGIDWIAPNRRERVFMDCIRRVQRPNIFVIIVELNGPRSVAIFDTAAHHDFAEIVHKTDAAV